MYRKRYERELSCKQVQNRFAEFQRYELSGEEALAVLEHCRECPECMDELKLLFMVRSSLDEENNNDDKMGEAEEELEVRYREVKGRIRYIHLIDRQLGFFVAGASFFLLLSLLIDWLY